MTPPSSLLEEQECVVKLAMETMIAWSFPVKYVIVCMAFVPPRIHAIIIMVVVLQMFVKLLLVKLLVHVNLFFFAIMIMIAKIQVLENVT